MRKIWILLIAVIFLAAVNVSFADNFTDVYVSNEGSDSLGNGSANNPYQTLGYTVEVASNNSNIYLKSGVYNSTGYEIVNKTLSITGVGEVTVDGANGKISQNIFKIHNGSCLTLNNIKFVNGYGSLDGDLSPITNEGELHIYNCYFNNFTTINGVISNYNYAHLNNVTSSNLVINWNEIYGDIGNEGFLLWILEQLEHAPRGELITNAANCLINNSIISSTIYNAKNMSIANSNVSYFVSNKKFLNESTFSYFKNSNIYTLRIANCTSVIFNNSHIYHDKTHLFISSNFFFENSTVSLKKRNDYNNYYLNFEGSNVTAISTIFYDDMIFGKGIVNITYSTILGKISNGYDVICDLNYNWWGDNKGPRISTENEYSSVRANYWIVMMLNDLGNSIFEVDFTKYTSGTNIFNLTNPTKFTPRLVKLEAESGKFLNNNNYLVNATFKSKLIDNNPNTIFYATVDKQILRMPIGEGITNYEICVSDSRGNDYFCDGSFDNPYKTLKKAVSKSFSGNTIYIYEGVYTLSWNADILISKNLTISGIGDVTLSRPNKRNIFVVDSKGILNLNNINFTTATNDGYYDPLIELASGNLNVRNCNFHDIVSQAVIISKNSEYINLDNVSFNNIRGPAILGFSSNLFVNNSIFSKGSIISLPTKYYGNPYPDTWYSSTHDLTYYISLSATITITNTIFSDNTAGAVGYYDSSVYPEFWNVDSDYYKRLKTYIYNSTFVNNKWDKDVMKNIDLGLRIGSYKSYTYRYGLVDNCTFLNNTGHLMVTSVINNSKFINNSAIPYLLRTDVDLQSKGCNQYASSLIKSNLINNSYFYGNVFLSKKYEEMIIEGNEVYSSVFIENRAAYGGALSNCSEVHYCVFVNNSATYGGDDIFLYSGKLNCSSNWWGSNQKPDSSRVYVFLGDLIIDNWVIMSITQEGDFIKASLDNLLDDNKNIYKLNQTLPSRLVSFNTQGGYLKPQNTFLINNTAYTELIRNTTKDFDVFAEIDNQIITLEIFNNSTQIIVENMSFYGKNNKYNITLLNINGHRIGKQFLNVIIRNSTGIVETLTLTTDDYGFASFDVNYPVGNYVIDINYYGNGYFEKSHAQASIKITSILTRLVSYNYTYYGKNNKFYAILADKYGKYISNQTLNLKIYNSKNKLIGTAESKTSSNGRCDVILSLDTGNYKLVWDFVGNEWYEKSHSESFITVKPINTTIELENSTFYGRGNDYKLIFKDAYGTLVSNEIINLKISNGTDTNQFKLRTEKGIASININLLPGVYNLEASYNGDEIYGPSKAYAILKIEPVFITLDYNSHISIPKNGVFTVILKDMYGKKVSGENISLELIYKTFTKKYNVVSDANGEANFKIDEDENNYFALIEYAGSTWYKSVSGASSITVSPDVILNNVYLCGNDFTAYYGENKYYTILFNDSNTYSLEGKVVSIIISSDDWSKSLDVESDVFGNVRLQITLNPGCYNISYKYQNNYYNLHAFGLNSINIFEMPTTLIASDLIVKKGDLKNFEVKLINKNGSPIPNLPININVDGKSFNVSTNNYGVAKLLIDLDLGYHNVTCLFDDEYYIKSYCNATILVVDDSKIITNIESNESSFKEGDLFNYPVILSDDLNNPIPSSEIVLNIFDLENNLIFNNSAYSNDRGLCVFNLNMAYGEYLAKTYYKGNEIYFESYNTNRIHVSPLENVTEAILFGNDCEIVNGYKGVYSVLLKTIDDEFICNASIEFVVKGYSYFSTTDSNGRAYLNVSLTPGAYEVKAKFAGSNNLTKALVTNYIRVSGELLYLYSQNIVKSFNNGTHYYVALFDALGQPLVGKIIKFSIDNETINRTTDSDGLACFEVWLNPGEYNIIADYQGEYPDEHASVSNNITVLTTLLSENIDKYYDGSTKIKASFLNFNNEILANTDVLFNINNITYKVKTDENGRTVFDLNLNPGNHILTVINTLTGQIGQYNVSILSTLKTSNLVKYYKGSQKFKATFKDKQGNLLKNTYVKFTFNGKNYKVKTNSNGVATLKINSKPGKYTITTLNTKTGEKHSNKITVKSRIITKNMKVKASKKINFQAKILKANGNIAKKVTVKFKINKKTYKVKTNSKGIAKLNIKLKKGNHVITTSYIGLVVKNTVRCS